MNLISAIIENYNKVIQGRSQDLSQGGGGKPLSVIIGKDKQKL